MLPQWFLFALIPPLLWAVTYHVDKIAITRYGKGVANIQLAIISGLGGVFVIAFLVLKEPSLLAVRYNFVDVLPVFLAGCVNVAATYFYYLGVSREEVTRVAPLYSFSPVFGILFGTLLLGEQISFVHMVGIAIVLIGGILVDSRVVKHILKINWFVLFVIACSCAGYTLSSVGFKYADQELGFNASLMWFFVGAVSAGALLLFPKAHRKGFKGLFTTVKRRKLFGLMVMSNIIGNTGRSVHNFAVLLVPIAFVQTVEAFESAFVLFIAVVLWQFSRRIELEDLSKKVFRQKMLSTAFVIVGTVILTL